MGVDKDEKDSVPDHNEVSIRGRVSADPVERMLPSGDCLVSFRLVVRRPARARRRSRVSVDTFDCVACTAAMRKKVATLAPGDMVEIGGSLRRRFRRVGTTATSRVDVEVDRCRRVRRGATST